MTTTDEDRVTLDMAPKKAGLPRKMCTHRFRGTGATEHLRKGGNLEAAARIAGHESTRTTPLCYRLSSVTRPPSTPLSAFESERSGIGGTDLNAWTVAEDRALGYRRYSHS